MALPNILQVIERLKLYLVPGGFIGMWSGSAETIPTGWALCDGANGTPNLTDRFILGAGKAYQPGATGGAATATPSVAAGSAKTGIGLGTAAPGGTAGNAGTGIGIQGTTLDGNTLPSHLHGVREYAGMPGENQNHIKGNTDGPAGGATSYTGNSWAHAHGVYDPGHAHAVGSSEHSHGLTDNGHDRRAWAHRHRRRAHPHAYGAGPQHPAALLRLVLHHEAVRHTMQSKKEKSTEIPGWNIWMPLS